MNRTTKKIAVKIRTATLLQYFLVFSLSIALRLLVSLRGHNYDFESFFQVGNLVKTGQSPWETNRYNYSPFGAQFFGLISFLSGDNFDKFRIIYVVILALSDIFIAVILLIFVNKLCFYLFLFSPISIILSGYHNQFDNIAILFGLISVIIGSNSPLLAKLNIRFNEKNSIYLKSLFLTLSLLIKHDLIFLTIWNLFREKKWKDKVVSGLLPPLFFIISFIPYLSYWDQIKTNVISYRSFNNAPFMRMLIPNQLLGGSNAFILFVVLLFILGWIFRKTHNDLIHFSLFLSSMFLFSSAIANQYLVIPMVAISIFPNLAMIPFLIFGSIFLLGEGNGLHYQYIAQAYPGILGMSYALLVITYSFYFITSAQILGARKLNRY